MENDNINDEILESAEQDEITEHNDETIGSNEEKENQEDNGHIQILVQFVPDSDDASTVRNDSRGESLFHLLRHKRF